MYKTSVHSSITVEHDTVRQGEVAGALISKGFKKERHLDGDVNGIATVDVHHNV